VCESEREDLQPFIYTKLVLASVNDPWKPKGEFIIREKLIKERAN
jgi:hypothetical protein